MPKHRRLLSTERERLICKALSRRAAAISELSSELGVSEATVRRDLESLESKGRLRRVHGGAELVKPASQGEPLFEEKTSLHASEKRCIAELALSRIDDADTIYLDGGSTVLELAKRLGDRRGLTVVTNSLMAAAELMETGHRLIIIGGEFRSLSRTLVGPLTAHVIDSLRIGKAFLGTIGFSVDGGISTTDPNEAFTKGIIMKRSERVFVLADSSKIGASSLAVSGRLADIDTLITDPGISKRALKALKSRRIEVMA